MADIIPDGYELLAGRSRVNAQKALASANERGFDKSRVRAVREGYLVPLEAEKAEATPDENWKVSEIDEWAEAHGIEVSGNKGEKVALINEALAAQKEGE